MIPKYETLKCDECGGTIGIYDRLICRNLGVGYFDSNPICDRCGKKFKFYQLSYDLLYPNNKTGWVFPVIYKEK